MTHFFRAEPKHRGRHEEEEEEAGRSLSGVGPGLREKYKDFGSAISG